jgi:adenylate cyclase
MKANKAVRPEIQAILDKRETQGLRFSILISAGILLFYAASTFATTSGTIETTIMSAFYVVMLAFHGLLHAMSKNVKRLAFVGFSLAGLGLAVIVIIPLIWYYSVGWTAVPASYFLKTVVPQLCLFLIVLAALPSRPAYPLIVASGAMAAMVVHLLLALHDPRSGFTKNFLEAVFGPPVLAGFVVSNFLFVTIVGLLCVLMANRSRKTVLEAVDLQNMNSQLSRYFSPNVMKKMAGAEASFFKPGGSVHNVAVLFSDIRSFTAISEAMSPDAVLRMLSDYQRRMTDAIFKYGGTLDKFIGDGIMATFGTPDPAPDDAARAVLAGLEMMRALDSLNEERLAGNFVPIRHGIGIHYGPALVGNVGTSERLEFTVIGDTVNAASRIESACKETGREFLISKQVMDTIKLDIETEDLGFIEVKGKSIPLNIFAPRSSMKELR